MITLRVYDAAKLKKEYSDYCDRYALYVPTPRKLIKEWGFRGIYLGFSFNGNCILRSCWSELVNGVSVRCLGGKVKRETLPMHVQKWINKLEKLYNNALKEDSDDAWDKWTSA